MAVRAWIVLGCLAALGAATAWSREWTDKAGKRFEADLVAVKGDKVYLERSDGTLITLPLADLSPADRDFLRSPETANAPATAARPGANPQGQALARRARTILEANCHRCHGQDGANEGGFNFVLNLEKVAEVYLSARGGQSTLLKRVTASDDQVMPPPGDTPRPSAEEIAELRAWVAAGAPSLGEAQARDFLGNEQVMGLIRRDLLQVAERSRRFQRYFTLTHLYNAGVSTDELQTYRLALAKLVNSLSWNPTLHVPEPIDPAGTILRIDIRRLNWTDQIWNDIARANPYELRLATPDALAAFRDAQTESPLVRADWFVHAASQPPLYHAILGIPKNERELEQLVRIDVAADIEQEKVVRAAFNRSGVSQNNRLIERHPSPYGSYWKSYDFAGNRGRQNLFERPLGPGGTEGFRHDGGEIIFSLPNGMQGYMLAAATGNRIDKGPTEIVSDPMRPDRAVVNGVSCMACHYAGMIPKGDEIRPVVEANRQAFRDAETIFALYPPAETLQRAFEEDANRFAAALRGIGIKKPSRTGEPVSTMSLRFEQELDLRHAAAEFGLAAADFSLRLDQAPALGRTLGALKVAGGTIKRDVFVEAFGRAAFDLRIVAKSSSVRGRLPSVGRDGPELAAGKSRDLGEMTWGVKSLAISPDGGRVAVGKMDEAVLVIDLNTANKLSVHERLTTLGQVTASIFTPNGERLLTGGYSGKIVTWEVDANGALKQAGQFVGHSGEILSIAVASDSRYALSGGRDSVARYWEIETGRELLQIPGFKRPIVACHLSENGREAIATDGVTLVRYDLSAKQVAGTLKLANGAAQGAAISPDGTRVVLADGYTLRMWNVATGAELPKFQDRETLWTVAFSSDGERLFSGGRGKVSIWEAATAKRLHTLDIGSGTGYIQTLALSPDGKYLAAIPSSAGQKLQLFRVPDDR